MPGPMPDLLPSVNPIPKYRSNRAPDTYTSGVVIDGLERATDINFEHVLVHPAKPGGVSATNYCIAIECIYSCTLHESHTGNAP